MFKKLLSILTSDQKTKLMMEENEDGLRPFEFASQQNVFDIVPVILTEVYATQSEVIGGFTYQCYDITEYECHKTGNRLSKCPLHFMVYMDVLSKKYSTNVFDVVIIKHWINGKLKANFPLMFLWLLFRILHYTMYTALDIMHVTSKTSANFTCANFLLQEGDYEWSQLEIFVGSILLLIYSGGMLIFDIVEFLYYYCSKHHRIMYKSVTGKRNCTVQEGFYRANQFILHLLTLTGCIIIALDVKDDSNLMSWIRLAAPLSFSWSILYFVQLVPVLGHFVIIMQRMMKTMLVFSVIFLFMMSPFMLVFGVSILQSETATCDDNLVGTVDKAFYTMFNMMLNSMDMSMNRSFLTQLLHVTFVFMVAILMINFLIAMMSDSVSDIIQNKSAIVAIQRLSVCVVLERRFGRLLSRYYDMMKGKHFIVIDDKIYMPMFYSCVEYVEPMMDASS